MEAREEATYSLYSIRPDTGHDNGNGCDLHDATEARISRCEGARLQYNRAPLARIVARFSVALRVLTGFGVGKRAQTLTSLTDSQVKTVQAGQTLVAKAPPEKPSFRLWRTGRTVRQALRWPTVLPEKPFFMSPALTLLRSPSGPSIN